MFEIDSMLKFFLISFISYLLQKVHHRLKECKRKNACEEKTIAFDAKFKVELVVSIQVIVENNEAQN